MKWPSLTCSADVSWDWVFLVDGWNDTLTCVPLILCLLLPTFLATVRPINAQIQNKFSDRQTEAQKDIIKQWVSEGRERFPLEQKGNVYFLEAKGIYVLVFLKFFFLTKYPELQRKSLIFNSRKGTQNILDILRLRNYLSFWEHWKSY